MLTLRYFFKEKMNSNESIIDSICSKYHLPSNCIEIIRKNMQNPGQFLKQLQKHKIYLKDSDEAAKYLSIINIIIVQSKYKIQILDCFSRLELIQLSQLNDEIWYKNLIKAYSCYISKLPMIADIFSMKVKFIPQKNHLTALYRIVNQVSILFPHLTIAINVVGRYFVETYYNVGYFLQCLSDEFLQVYENMKYLIQQFFINYHLYQKEDILNFLKSLSCFEIICDKIEQFNLNKYLKGKKITSKIGFKEENIAQLNYYINCIEKENNKETWKDQKSAQFETSQNILSKKQIQ